MIEFEGVKNIFAEIKMNFSTGDLSIQFKEDCLDNIISM